MKTLRQNESALNSEPIDFILISLSKFAWYRWVDLANLLFNFFTKFDGLIKNA
jgi:hypothetical protein